MVNKRFIKRINNVKPLNETWMKLKMKNNLYKARQDFVYYGKKNSLLYEESLFKP